MAIRVVVADDAKVMRETIARLIRTEPTIDVVGEAANFGETLEVTAALAPDIVVMDLYMPDAYAHPPGFIKSTLSENTGCTLAISIWTDDTAKALAENLGAKILFDKAKLGAELIPAIFRFCYPDRYPQHELNAY